MRILISIIGSLILFGYSYACFFKPKWVLWLSVSPTLAEKNPITPISLVVHGFVSIFTAVSLLVWSVGQIIGR